MPIRSRRSLVRASALAACLVAALALGGCRPSCLLVAPADLRVDLPLDQAVAAMEAALQTGGYAYEIERPAPSLAVVRVRTSPSAFSQRPPPYAPRQWRAFTITAGRRTTFGVPPYYAESALWRRVLDELEARCCA